MGRGVVAAVQEARPRGVERDADVLGKLEPLVQGAHRLVGDLRVLAEDDESVEVEDFVFAPLAHRSGGLGHRRDHPALLAHAQELGLQGSQLLRQEALLIGEKGFLFAQGRVLLAEDGRDGEVQAAAAPGEEHVHRVALGVHAVAVGRDVGRLDDAAVDIVAQRLARDPRHAAEIAGLEESSLAGPLCSRTHCAPRGSASIDAGTMPAKAAKFKR